MVLSSGNGLPLRWDNTKGINPRHRLRKNNAVDDMTPAIHDDIIAASLEGISHHGRRSRALGFDAPDEEAPPPGCSDEQAAQTVEQFLRETR